MIVLMSFRGDKLSFNFMLFKLFIEVPILSLTHKSFYICLMSYQICTINIMYLHPRKYNVKALTQFTLTPALGCPS